MERWDKSGIPHKGWTLVGCVELGEGVFGDNEMKYKTCEMCNNERIRCVHILTKPVISLMEIQHNRLNL